MKPFTNCHEITQQIALDVEGKLPAWVSGVLYRMGGGVFHLSSPDGTRQYTVNHPFDALPVVHRFEFADGKVRYSNRRTARAYEERLLRGEPAFSFGRDPCQTIFHRLQSFYKMTLGGKGARTEKRDPSSSVVNVTVTPNFPLGEKGALVAKTDANSLQQLDPITLEPIKLFDYGLFDERLKGDLSAAHHQEDEKEYVNFVFKFGRTMQFRLFGLGRDSSVRIFGDVGKHLVTGKPVVPSYIHSFSMTDKYIILPNYPLYYSWGGLSVLYYGNLVDSFYWDEKLPTLYHVVDRISGGHIATYEGPPCFAFHTLNAWDEGDDIVFDASAYDNADVIWWSYEFGKKPGEAQPAGYYNPSEKKPGPKVMVRRYRLRNIREVARQQSEPNNKTVAKVEVHDTNVKFELARINSNFERRRNRYVYGVTVTKTKGGEGLLSGLGKGDLEKGTTINWEEPGYSCSEPIFIPRPGATEEDDGAVVSVVNSATSEDCFLVVLDGKTFKELARARIGEFTLPSLHGSFVDSQGKSVTVN
ncbi:uncharacterized protein VTP21DRAFT_10870 [Calcarisporiella thermophila]|uniref:uncharacterized protein n=1 Tax=Calcarisporiella thermophila TaxID=911321 RepID=UPI0037432F88